LNIQALPADMPPPLTALANRFCTRDSERERTDRYYM